MTAPHAARPVAGAIAATIVALVLASVPFGAAAPIRVMLLDGANNHDWKATSPVIAKILDETGLFTTTTVTVDNSVPRYFMTPTPGTANGLGNPTLGPLILGATHSPNVPFHPPSLKP